MSDHADRLTSGAPASGVVDSIYGDSPSLPCLLWVCCFLCGVVGCRWFRSRHGVGSNCSLWCWFLLLLGGLEVLIVAAVLSGRSPDLLSVTKAHRALQGELLGFVGVVSGSLLGADAPLCCGVPLSFCLCAVSTAFRRSSDPRRPKLAWSL